MDKTYNAADWESMAKKTQKDVTDAIDQLRKIVNIYDPIELLGRIATYILSGLPNEHKDAGGPKKSETNLEYLVSFVAAHPAPEKIESPSPHIVQQSIDLITQIHTATTLHYISKKLSKSDFDNPIEELADSFRRNKLHVRGDGYWPHLRKTMLELLVPHSEKLKRTLGFDYIDYLSFMDRTEKEVSNQVGQQMSELGYAYIKLMKPWLSKGNADVFEAEDFKAFVETNRESISAAKENFDSIGDSSLYIFHSLTKEENTILNLLSTEVGSNKTFLGKKPEHAFWPLTTSDTESHPILVREGVYYAFNLLKLQREAYTLIGDLLREHDEKYWEHKFLNARDEYLEQETANLLHTVFPKAQVLRNVKYPLASGGRSEADIVVVMGGVLMVVECKAGRLHAATRRGGEAKVVKDMEKTVIEGLNQAERFVSELIRLGTMEIIYNGRSKGTIYSTEFSRVFSINVTLELMTSATSTLWELQEAGLLADTKRSWSVSLNDLRVIVEILNTPALFLHYIVRRLDTMTIKSVQASDELEYLMRYVLHGLFFREGNAPKENENIMLVRYTDDLDQYYRRVQGLTEEGRKPKVNLGKHTSRILNILEKQRPVDWLVGSIEILEFDVSIREELFGKIQGHLKLLKDKKAAFGLSFAANFDASDGIAVATSRDPEAVRRLVVGRCQRHCRDQGLKKLSVLLFGVPIVGAKCAVLKVNKDSTEVGGAGLLSQLRFETIEFRKTKR